jgi:hypothetical protein
MPHYPRPSPQAGWLRFVERSHSTRADEVDVRELASDNGSAIAAAGWLLLEFSVGIEYNAWSVIAASSCEQCEPGLV